MLAGEIALFRCRLTASLFLSLLFFSFISCVVRTVMHVIGQEGASERQTASILDRDADKRLSYFKALVCFFMKR